MSLFATKEERAAKQAERAREQEAVRANLTAHLKAAATAAESGDIQAEETEITRAMALGEQHNSWRWAFQKEATQAIESWTQQGKVRRSPWLGFVGSILFFEDRIVVYDEAGSSSGGPKVLQVDGSTRAEVMSEGELRTTKRPTLTRMAVGSILPGTALIPGFALQKKETIDDRRLFFTVEHGAWGRIVELNAQQVDPLQMRQLAMSINQAAAKRSHESNTAVEESRSKSDAVEALKKLGELREAGVITAEEFEAKKAKLLEAI